METRVDTHNYTYNYLNKNINKKQYTIKQKILIFLKFKNKNLMKTRI